ncbi:hypothetical protein D3C77_666700 [compost metagenome]
MNGLIIALPFQRLLGEFHMGKHILSCHLAFAALPRMEAARRQRLKRFFMTALRVQQRHVFHIYIIPLINKLLIPL